MSMTSAQAIQAAMQQDAAICAAIIQNCPIVRQRTATYTQVSNPYVNGVGTTINVPLTNVGLIRKLWVRVRANLQQGAAETQTRTTFGPANFLSQVIFQDLQNLVRHNTQGWHLSNVAAAKRQFPLGAAITSDNSIGIGSNFGVCKAPAIVTAAANMDFMYEIPLAYSDTDLRGAVFAQVLNATMNLQLTINPFLYVASGADATFAMYQSSTAQLGKLNTYTIDVYQEYYDQLPRDQQGNYIKPNISLSTQYSLLTTSQAVLAVNTDLSLFYQNLRTYMSTFVIFDNGGTLNAGTDINTFTMQTANQMRLFSYDAIWASLFGGRTKINDDWQLGTYYFDHRAMPISTLAVGNVALVLNPSVVNANASVQLGYEYFQNQNTLNSSSSIPSN